MSESVIEREPALRLAAMDWLTAFGPSRPAGTSSWPSSGSTATEFRLPIVAAAFASRPS